MSEKFVCPAADNKCDTCVGLARGAMADTLQQAGYSETQARVSAENARLTPLVNGEHLPPRALNMLPCAERQVRAQQIGQRLAATSLNHHE